MPHVLNLWTHLAICSFIFPCSTICFCTMCYRYFSIVSKNLDWKLDSFLHYIVVFYQRKLSESEIAKNMSKKKYLTIICKSWYSFVCIFLLSEIKLGRRNMIYFWHTVILFWENSQTQNSCDSIFVQKYLLSP